ncbi:Ada metal-binding domain-containing protein [Streptomyces sp. NPDC058872]|uniref:Ada metal-binding domain-containing protein n=1 Tax=Streptomyces sp. NPDC058872 TaxID=3346661 RepID=UPI00367A9D66
MRAYTLVGPDGKPYRSPDPGTLGGHRRGRLYGRLDCPSALRALARGGYVRERVFFADEATAVAAGYRPCAVCLPERYRAWKTGRPPLPAPDEAPASPLLTADEEGSYGELPLPAPHTEAELAALTGLLTAPRSRISTVVIGHSRDTASTAAARAFAAGWEGRGGQVLAVVDWPESAASWLRAARRLTAQTPDAWVVAAAGPGFAQLARRLRHSTDWDPSRSYAFASLADARVPALAGPATLHGLRGATADGGTWEVRGRWVVSVPPVGAPGAREG